MITPEGKKLGYFIIVEGMTGEPKVTEQPSQWYVAKDITDQEVTVFNTRNATWSDNSVYKSSKGYYFKKDGKRWYLNQAEN